MKACFREKLIPEIQVLWRAKKTDFASVAENENLAKHCPINAT